MIPYIFGKCIQDSFIHRTDNHSYIPLLIGPSAVFRFFSSSSSSSSSPSSLSAHGTKPSTIRWDRIFFFFSFKKKNSQRAELGLNPPPSFFFFFLKKKIVKEQN